MEGKKKSFLSEKKELLTAEKGIKKRKFLLNLKIHRRTLRNFENARKKLWKLDEDLAKKLNFTYQKILETNDLLKKLNKDKIDFTKGRKHLVNSFAKVNKAISKEESKIKILENNSF